MKREISILAIFVGLVAFAMIFSGCGRKTTEPVTQSEASQTQGAAEQTTEENIGKPWIEVVMDGTYIVLNESEKQVLKTGDELNEGEVVETDETGLANVYFPDGSVARMDSNTKIEITTGQYDYDSKSLKVRISLLAGNMWSKIIKLATPESVWEVETSNAVAAVRGSAFGSSFMEKKTTIIGSEHNISVSPKGPNSGSVISNQKADVGEKQIIVISPDNLPGYMSHGKDIKGDVKTASDSDYKPKWIASSIAADKLINARLSELQSQGLSEEQSREMFGREIMNKFNPAPRQPSAIIKTEQKTEENKGDEGVQAPVQQKPAENIKPETETDNTSQTDDIGAESQNTTDETGMTDDTTSSTTSTEPNTDDTWSDIPVATGTSPNLGDFFIEDTAAN